MLEVKFEASKIVPTAFNNIDMHPWLKDTDRVVQGRLSDAILIRVRGLADFVVRPAATSVHCYFSADTDPVAVRHFLLNQVLPRLVSIRDPLVIHAGAVAARLGAIALIGPAGFGKSTLSSSFTVSGAGKLIADDGVLLRLEGQTPYLIGAYTRSRLRPDSLSALGLGTEFLPRNPVGGKHVLMSAPEQRASAVPMALRGLFLLTPAQPGRHAIEISPLTGSAAVIALIGNSFLLDSSDRSLVQRQFEAATALVRSGCPFYSLAYPRCFADLPEVQARILAALGP
ncbi:MAG TPA: hypothetical protein VES73_09050 [Lamprocystis sp. (in: g-proteobacteria)]|nr:hypothetical protein [Lamprocystis sp. (in: g-proteobacteria)]